MSARKGQQLTLRNDGCTISVRCENRKSGQKSGALLKLRDAALQLGISFPHYQAVDLQEEDS
jgi:hypothetical protein